MFGPVLGSQAKFTVAANVEDKGIAPRTMSKRDRKAIFCFGSARQSFLSENGMQTSLCRNLKSETSVGEFDFVRGFQAKSGPFS
jgi:hypothetical protein